MTSPVNWALLGLVIDRASYGLELAHRFQRLYADILPLSSESHIYAALNSLETRAMIEVAPGTGLGRQPKPHYQATELGVRSHQEWLVGQIEEERRRQALWVRQLAIFVDDPDTALAMIGRYEHEVLESAGQIGRAAADMSTLDSRAGLIDRLAAEQNRIAAGGMLSWLQHARSVFEALAANKPRVL